MRNRGRSTSSNRVSDRQTISRPPNYNPRRSIDKSPTSFQSLSGGPPIYRHDMTGRNPQNTRTKEENERDAD